MHGRIVHTVCHAWVPCSTGLAMLASAKQAHANRRASVKTTTHLPHNMQQSIHYNCVQSRKPGVIGRLNGQHWTSTVDKAQSNFFRPADLVSCMSCVSTHAQKAFKFEHWHFTKAVLRQELNLQWNPCIVDTPMHTHAVDWVLRRRVLEFSFGVCLRERLTSD